MAKVLFNLGRWSYLHKWTVIIAWALILGVVGGAAGAFQKGFDDQFSIPGMPSSIASHMIEAKFPNQPNPIREQTVYVVFAAPEGQRLSDPENMKAADEVVASIKQNIDQLTADQMLVNPVRLNPELQKRIVEAGTGSGLPENVARADAHALRTLSEDGRYGISQFAFDVRVPKDITPKNRQALFDAMKIGKDAGLQVEAMGPGMMDPVAVNPTSEIIGISIAAAVLIITFGSLVAAGLPLITAVVGIVIGSLLVVFMTAFKDVNSITPVLAVMIGLAVGIDYALFILSRYRAERSRGLTRPDAVGMATGTAGSSVVFAGLTVIVALAALVIAKVPFLSLMGISAAITVGIAVIISLTLLPALMALFGGKIFAGKIPGIAGNPLKAGRRPLFGGKTMGRRWVEAVHKAPGLFLVGAVGILVALSVPAANLQLALPSDSTSPYGSTQRNAIQLASQGFGPGRNAQMLIIADADNVNPNSTVLAPVMRGLMAGDRTMTPEQAARKASFSYALDNFKNNVDVEHVQIIRLNEEGTGVLMMLTPKAGPLDSETGSLISALRQQQNQIKDATGLVTGVTGLIPIEQDITERLSDAMPLYLSVVIGLAIVLLLLVFRSLVVPLTAGLGFLLSVGAAFGVTVLFWQQGLWGLVHTPGPLVSFIPIFMIGVTFGLAMDYQVFLVSRMREHFTHSKGKPREGSQYTAVEESVVEGFSLGARVVTAAAIIMIAVFVAFIGQPLAFVKVFGFALGAAVLFDAFLVRMTLIPASMFLLGRTTWWMPKWMDRILPSVDVEGTALEEKAEELAAAGEAERQARAGDSSLDDDSAPKKRGIPKLRGAKKSKAGKFDPPYKSREIPKLPKKPKKAKRTAKAEDAVQPPTPANAAGAAKAAAGTATGAAAAGSTAASTAAGTAAAGSTAASTAAGAAVAGATAAALSPTYRDPARAADDEKTRQFPIVEAELVEEPKERPVKGGTAQRPEPHRTPFSTPYVERRLRREEETAARADKTAGQPKTAPKPAPRPAPQPASKSPAQPMPQPRTATHPQPHRATQGAPGADGQADESISVQDLIKREGGHSRPRRRRALWDPRDYDEIDRDD
ncbi:Membrane protein YdfJ [Corynebacterium hansenii]|nr:MMPL family transporter [Corynebacterium hansenii]WJY98796.1 Membrane protein YdfJ [Corynebacterium hansenii]